MWFQVPLETVDEEQYEEEQIERVQGENQEAAGEADQQNGRHDEIAGIDEDGGGKILSEIEYEQAIQQIQQQWMGKQKEGKERERRETKNEPTGYGEGN